MPATPLRLAALLLSALPSAAAAARSDWVAADRSELRLLLAPPLSGELRGGVDIRLDPDWYTYWRDPGDAGVPPVFDFTGSENVASVDVRYPAPERHDDGMSVSLTYSDEVVFPLIVTPTDPAKPVRLDVSASFGVCREICIPTHATASVAVDSTSSADPLTEALLAEYDTRIPGAPEPGVFDIEAAALRDGALHVDVRMPDSSYADLFADPPDDWYVGQPELVERRDGVSRYRLAAASRPHDAGDSAPVFRFVAVAGARAIEKLVPIQ
jgi:DsbC/DsbD-like thiol-disulfide interchange protein